MQVDFHVIIIIIIYHHRRGDHENGMRSVCYNITNIPQIIIFVVVTIISNNKITIAVIAGFAGGYNDFKNRQIRN